MNAKHSLHMTWRARTRSRESPGEKLGKPSESQKQHLNGDTKMNTACRGGRGMRSESREQRVHRPRGTEVTALQKGKKGGKHGENMDSERTVTAE